MTSVSFLSFHDYRLKSLILWFIICVYLFGFAFGIEYSKAAEGYPEGFLSNCPGSWRPAHIKPESLKKLYIAIMGPGNVLQAKWTKYDYYHMKELSKNPGIDFSKKTFMYVGGYLDGITLPLGRTLGQAYKDLGYNVLILDYFHFTATDFPVAVRLTRPVGKHVAEMLANLTSLGLNPKTLELAGLSLGGETMSFIAKNYRQITGRNISTLTGMDPTGPCFRHLPPDQRLDASDADFVRVIATNIDIFGIATPVGHVTFYVNGGEFQPGDALLVPCDTYCSHTRSYSLWLSSLMNPGLFIGMQCDSVQQARDSDCYDRVPRVTNTLDLYTDKSKPGIYYLNTFNRYPYGLGKRGLKRSGQVFLNYLGSMNSDDRDVNM